MATHLSSKQKGFVKDYLQTGVGSEAVRRNYDIEPSNTKLASVIAAENLAKPSIIEAIRRGTKNEQIEEAFNKLINLKRLDYFVFPKFMEDEEIRQHVEAQGITVLNVRPSEKGKLAFFAIPDGMALARALEIWAKVAGAFAPEKVAHMHAHIELSTDSDSIDLDTLVKEAESRLKEQKTNG